MGKKSKEKDPEKDLEKESPKEKEKKDKAKKEKKEKKSKDKVQQIATAPRIVVDAMGGDYAPREIVKGAVEAARELNAELVLVGQQEAIQNELSHYDLEGARISIHPAEDVIGMDEDPVRAIRRKPNSSIVAGMNLIKNGQADAFLSGGSTGAITAAGLLILGMKKNIKRPALAIVFESPAGPVLFLDVGANADCKPQHLVHFAQMGNIFMQKIFNVPTPRIGLLSTGEEATKGNKVARSTHATLAKGQLNFIGNVEGRGLIQGNADVVVTDGFTGNVVIKLFEGLGELLSKSAKQSSDNESIPAQTKGPILNYAPGALLLGVNGNVIKTHGRSDSIMLKQAIRVAERMVRQRILETIGT
ncbi:MAG: phosphate acyltransferase PlsX [Dehalococcoidia bacterium]|nr:phosphate acyltransferase PlsX [Dehalococcoidia bacterium]